MADNPDFSQKLLSTGDAKSPGALARISIAKRRIQSVLDTYTIAHQRTLEQKISEQGPDDMRVDPHLLGLAIMDLLELNRLRNHTHPSTNKTPWYANPGTKDAAIKPRLNELAPLYASVVGNFGNLAGDALELIVFKCLRDNYLANRRYSFLGQFHLDQPKDANGRYKKTHPQRNVAGFTTTKEADFVLFGHSCGHLASNARIIANGCIPLTTFCLNLLSRP